MPGANLLPSAHAIKVTPFDITIDILGCVHYQLGLLTDIKPDSRQDQIRTEC
jgi:hypothetical protein